MRINSIPGFQARRQNFMFCRYCGKEIGDNAIFCSKCGKKIGKESAPTENMGTEALLGEIKTPDVGVSDEHIEKNGLMEENSASTEANETSKENCSEQEKVNGIESNKISLKFCRYCGKQIQEESVFCSKCGKKLVGQSDTYQKENSENQRKNSWLAKANLDEKFPAKNLFINVFKKHTAHERAEILKAGIDSDKNLDRVKITADKLRPWFYSRIFVILFAVFIIFEICLLQFNNSNVMPGVMLIGSLMMPFAILTMFFELNVYRDISFFRVMGIFLLGGAISLLFTLFLYEIIPAGSGYGLINASLVSIIEEIGKVVIVIVILRRSKNTSVLHGLLVGGAVGCGFAVFESAGYAFNIFLDAHDYNNFYFGYVDSLGEMNFTIFLRSVLSFGGHTAWAAVEGASFAREKKINKNFIIFFGLCFAMHTLWDTGTPVEYLKLAALCIAAWWVILRQIGKFIAEIK